MEASVAPEGKAARPWLAGLLALVVPGLAQYYAGRGFGVSFALCAAAVLWQYIALRLPGQVLGWRAAYFATFAMTVPVGIGFMIDAVKTARRLGVARAPRQRRDYALFTVATLAMAALFAFAADATGYKGGKNFRVPTASMEPTIMVGDRIRCDLTAYADGRFPARGDIVVFRYPRDPKVPYVKRVIGLPGETLRIADDVLLVDGQPVDLKLKRGTHPTNWPTTGSGYPVPLGSFFVIGDNLTNSTDSRVYGAVKHEALIGKAVGIVFRQSAEVSGVLDRFFLDFE